jgi:hypothetical protein
MCQMQQQFASGAAATTTEKCGAMCARFAERMSRPVNCTDFLCGIVALHAMKMS